MLTIKQLKEVIKDLPDDMVVAIHSDSPILLTAETAKVEAVTMAKIYVDQSAMVMTDKDMLVISGQ